MYIKNLLSHKKYAYSAEHQQGGAIISLFHKAHMNLVTIMIHEYANDKNKHL